ncbi:reticulophagy regulator 1 isoform X1 [Hyla sarda]|uniref:reticulophagy regulator 1 isoform X1 n=1 Tax=Hyla sarda TaxID=327740 RepID=UPI0024C24AE1|nr:reticulophagy regulator 1 isoform X1 [Hyla sarda]
MAGTATDGDTVDWAPGREPGQLLWGKTLERLMGTLTWQRPLYTLAVFICCNFLFWYLAVTPWRIYHLLSLILIGLVLVQIIKHFLLSRSRGAKLWRGIVKRKEAAQHMKPTDEEWMCAAKGLDPGPDFSKSRKKTQHSRWEVISANSECKPRLSQCIAESWSSYTVFLHELSHFKQQNPGKFCLLVCSVCTFFILLGSYIPGVVLSYFILVCAFLCPLLKCNEIGQKMYSKLKPVLQKLELGLQLFVSLLMKAKSKKEVETISAADDSELELSSLCPQINAETLAKELSVSGSEPSDLSWTENGTFNLSEGYTPQTDTSDDLDRPSEEEVFSRDLTEFPSPENGSGSNDEDSSIGIPSAVKRKHEKSHKSSAEQHSASALSILLGTEQPYNLVTGAAGEAITAAVTAAITDQLQSALLCAQPPAAGLAEDTDTEEVDDFELLDQSELEDIDNEVGHSSSPDSEGKKPSSGFLSSLLGSH